MFTGSLYRFQAHPDLWFPADLSQLCNLMANDEPAIDLQGKVLKIVEGNFDEINLSPLNNGMYLMNVTFQSKYFETYKLQIAY